MKNTLLAMSLFSVSVLPVSSFGQIKGEVDASGAMALTLPAAQPEVLQVKAARKAEGITAAQLKAARGEAEYASMGAVGRPTPEQQAAAMKRRSDTLDAVKNRETETDKP